MKIKFPTTQDGWFKLARLIAAKNENMGHEPPVNPADADVDKIRVLSRSASENLANAVQMHRLAEAANEAGNTELAGLEEEIRRLARVLSGRYRHSLRQMGAWGFNMDETSPPDEKETPQKAPSA